jgi:hydrogenase nickel incorporation protein HypA/HybF
MHELPVTQSILEIALRHAEQADAVRITDLYLVIGDLSSIIDDSVQFYWDIISRDTIAEGATLHFERTPTEMMCFTCNAPYYPERGTLNCPTCGGDQVHVTGGEEFRLDSINVETAETAPTPPTP